MRLLSIEAENFKGVRHGVLTFDGKNARITGENGSGKSTYADAHAWMWMDTDYAGNSKPDIRPDGADCDDGVVTRVTETTRHSRLRRFRKSRLQSLMQRERSR